MDEIAAPKKVSGTFLMPAASKRVSQEDLDTVSKHAHRAFESLRDARIFVTGGTGFFGKWLLETFSYANRQLKLNAQLTALSRNPEKLAQELPHLAQDSSIRFLSGDISTFSFPPVEFTHVIHGATSTDPRVLQSSPDEILKTILAGTKRVLDLAKQSKVRRFLFLSSGAVYGKQSPDVANLQESELDLKHPPAATTTYAEGKRQAEQLCLTHSKDFETVSARCFTFIGPHLPLDYEFAAGNFIRDALAGKPIQIQGDGTPLRSYLYMTDLTVALWSLLTHGRTGEAYNVGSETAVSILELAQATARVAESLGLKTGPIQVAKQPIPWQKSARYVPSTAKIQRELNITQTIPLEPAILKTMKFLI